MLKLTNASSIRHGRSFGPFTLDIKSGVLLVIGPNGSGKTTFLRSLAGLTSLSGEWTVPKSISYLHQDNEGALLGNLSVRENVCYYLQGIRGMEVDVTLLNKTASALGLQQELETCTKVLSGGFRQLTHILRVLVSGGRLLLLDEPTRNLDQRARHLTRQCIEQIASSSIVVIVAHDLHDLDDICSHVLLIKEGKQSFFGTRKEFFSMLTFAQVIEVDAVIPNGSLPEAEIVLMVHSGSRTIVYTRKSCDHSPVLMEQVLHYVNNSTEIRVRNPGLSDALTYLSSNETA